MSNFRRHSLRTLRNGSVSMILLAISNSFLASVPSTQTMAACVNIFSSRVSKQSRYWQLCGVLLVAKSSRSGNFVCQNELSELLNPTTFWEFLKLKRASANAIVESGGINSLQHDTNHCVELFQVDSFRD